MRIIGGEWRGRKLQAPPGQDTRPTSDRARQTLFDIITHRYAPLPQDAQVLDLFAGTGALGLEALSRGARRATFVDQDKTACDIIEANIQHLRAGSQCTLLRADATRFLHRGAPFDLVFADPPYGKGLLIPALTHLLAAHLLAADALLVLETGHGDQVDLPDALTLLDRRRIGISDILFLRVL